MGHNGCMKMEPKVDAEKLRMQKKNRVKINVGGQVFLTRRKTLQVTSLQHN